MANVSSVSDIKKAIQNKERVLVPTNKLTELILLAASKLPEATFAEKLTAVGTHKIAYNAVSEAVALTGAQIWAIIAISGLILLIGMLRAKNVRIKVEGKNPPTFVIEYNDMGK